MTELQSITGARPGPDEGYSGENEETRSLTDEDAAMQVDTAEAEMVIKATRQTKGFGNAEGEDDSTIVALVEGMTDKQKSILLDHLLRSLSQDWKTGSCSVFLGSQQTC